MKNFTKLILLFLISSQIVVAQLPLNFGSSNWDYSYKQPIGGVCTPPSDSPSGVSWTSPAYGKPMGEWTFVSNSLPIGYNTPPSPIDSYGVLKITTLLPFGSDPANKPTTAYLRQTITLTTIPRSSYASFTLKLKADDGVRIYFNGTEVVNHNLPPGSINSNTSANVAVGTEIDDHTFIIPNTFASNPTDANKITITAEIHQSTTGLANNCTTPSSDMFFDMQLTGTLPDPNTLVGYGSSWSYSHNGSMPVAQSGVSWFNDAYDFSSWSQGPSSFGFNETVNTTLNSSIYTAYFRKDVAVPNFATYTKYYLKMIVDDGAVIYFNGVRVAYLRMDALSSYGYSTFANTIVGPGSPPQVPEGVEVIIPVDASYVTSSNLKIAVEVHQCDAGSSDMFFNLKLIGSNETPTLTRGPYLQLPHPTGMQIRWQTNIAEIGKVCYSSDGLISGSNSGTCVSELMASTEHLINITGLTENSNYFYAIENTTNTLFLGGANYKFITPPSGVNNSIPTRIWVTGDASQNHYTDVQAKVLNAFENYKSTNSLPAPDLWLLLGDIGNEDGTLGEFDDRFFQSYVASSSHIMQQTPILVTPGNHDYYSGPDFTNIEQTTIKNINDFTSTAGLMNTFFISTPGRALSNFRATKNNPFYNLFSFPDGSKPTSLSSKYSTTNSPEKKSYYSYNHNNIHFISLDSYGFYNNHLLYAGIPSSPLQNPQMAWLMDDLAHNNQLWTIMYWHHSPYTKGGGHNSDLVIADEFILTGIREKLIKYLDDSNYKIDLVLNGHSHHYERSRLLKGHYGLSSTFETAIHNNNSVANASHNGKFTSSSLECPYIKSSTGPNEGIVYVVTGSAGQIQEAQDNIDFSAGHKALNGAYFRPTITESVAKKDTALHGTVNRTTLSSVEETKGGSFYIEVKGNRLDAKFIEEVTGNVTDNFTIFKDVNKGETLVKLITPTDLPAQSPQLQSISSPWPQVNGLEITNPLTEKLSFTDGIATVANPIVGQEYTLKDSYGCLTQKYRFHFDNKCWPNGVSINNTIFGPNVEIIKSSTFINASNTIKANSKVFYQAASAINLNQNTFKVENNAVFTATIVSPCSN